MPRILPHDATTTDPPIAGLLAALLLIAAPAEAELIDGIDVSHWQGDIDWGQVHGSGVEFAFIKATESTAFVDSKFNFNMLSSRAQGVLSGPYHFARPDTGQSNPLDAANEAMHFAATIRPYYESGGYLRPVIDLEVRPGGCTASDRVFYRSGSATLPLPSRASWAFPR